MKEALESFFKQTNNRYLNFIVGGSLIVVFLYNLVMSSVAYFQSPEPINGFGCSEFLINYQGGFVRRGILGELLYDFYQITPFPVVTVITVISYMAFFFVMIFFLRQCYTKRYCWWILFSPAVLGMSEYIVRKDYILYILLFLCLYLLRGTQTSLFKRFCALVLITFGLFLHEAFIFFGFPIFALLMLSENNGRILNRVFVIIPIITFLILCVFKGTPEIAAEIADSWNALLPDASITSNCNSIGALGWNASDIFSYHIKMNLGEKAGGAGIVLLPCIILASYFMITNFFYVFRKKCIQDAETDRLTLSLLYSLAVLCLLPMFTFLSCDMGRIFQYAAVATFASFFIIPNKIITGAFPKWYVRTIEHFNTRLNGFVLPSKGLMLILLFFLGVSPKLFLVDDCMWSSIMGGLVQIALMLRVWLGYLFI